MRWAALLFLVACHAQPGEDKADDCAILCRCLVAVPGQQNQCVQECTTQLDDNDTCTSCLFDNESSCTVVKNTCLQECQQLQPPTGGN